MSWDDDLRDHQNLFLNRLMPAVMISVHPGRGEECKTTPALILFFSPIFHLGGKKKTPENLKTSSNFPGSRGTVFDTLAYCVPPLPGKVIKLLFSTPKLCHRISIQHWRTFGNNPPALPYPPLEGGRTCHVLSLILDSLPLRPPSFPAPLLVSPQSSPSSQASPFGQTFLSSPCGGAPGQPCDSHCFSVSNSTQ